MLPINALRDALRSKGYGELRSVTEGNLRFLLMTDGVHVLVLQEYADGGAELFAPLGTGNDLESTIAAIPLRTFHGRNEGLTPAP